MLLLYDTFLREYEYHPLCVSFRANNFPTGDEIRSNRRTSQDACFTCFEAIVAAWFDQRARPAEDHRSAIYQLVN